MNDQIVGGGRSVNIGQSQLLYKYLRGRFADRVVLTFVEIEDVLGFALPAAARSERAWWNGDGSGNRTAQADAWMLANRTAVVNLPAKHVLFERLLPQ